MKRAIAMADWLVTWRQVWLVLQVLRSGRLTYGDKTRQLEKKFADLHDREHALFTSSGTAALKIALHALKDKYGWKDGDEVIVPSVTFVATVNVIVMNNLKPVIVDVRKDTVNIDPKKIEKAITDRTRAILPVHLLGQPADMAAIMEIAKRYDLRVVEDSCETMFITGEVLGDVACYSTYIAHHLVTGVGGFITTNDKELATTMRSMMFHGRDEAYLNIDDNNKTGKDFTEMVNKRFHFPRFGYSDRMTELEAALGLGEIKHWKDMIDTRQENAVFLILSLPPQVEIPVQDVSNHAFMFFPAFVQRRDELVEHLEKNGIHTRHMMPLTTQPIMQRYVKDKHFPNADYVNKNGILLPCHQHLTKRELHHMVKVIREFYQEVKL